MTELTDLTLSQVSDRLNQRSVSAVELTEATLQVIEETEPIVHAYARVLGEQALGAAREADKEIAAGNRRSAVHGIPIAIKDNIYTAGIPTESGSKVMEGFVPDYDATVVRLLKEAGAILVGKAVCHEFAYGVNQPLTRTPWCMDCYPGGSSIGSGVTVTVRSAFGALGTDTGGSIRVPAFINGLVGLKPTYGRVSIYGVVPVAWSLDHVGPLTRTVKDTAHILQAISGYDPNDAFSANEPVPDFTAGLEDNVRGLRIGIEREYFFYDGLAADVRTAVEAVIAEYEEQGVEFVDVSLPEFEVTPDALFTIVLCEGSTYHRQLIREHGDKYDPTTRSLVQLGELIPATHYLTAQRARALFRTAMRNLFKNERLDAMLWPTLPLTTVPFDELYIPRKDGVEETPMVSFVRHSFNANLTGQPALNVPCGFSSAGLPIGFQLFGRPFDEVTLFRIAHAYEQNHDWFKRKPNLNAG